MTRRARFGVSPVRAAYVPLGSATDLAVNAVVAGVGIMNLSEGMAPPATLPPPRKPAIIPPTGVRSGLMPPPPKTGP